MVDNNQKMDMQRTNSSKVSNLSDKAVMVSVHSKNNRLVQSPNASLKPNGCLKRLHTPLSLSFLIIADLPIAGFGIHIARRVLGLLGQNSFTRSRAYLVIGEHFEDATFCQHVLQREAYLGVRVLSQIALCVLLPSWYQEPLRMFRLSISLVSWDAYFGLLGRGSFSRS